MNINEITRILSFNFIYKNIQINLIAIGETPYIHSILFRAYSIMDSRFAIIGMTLKYFLKKLVVPNEFNFNTNTFPFMSLLVAFLQDIIQPPILPKIFSVPNSNNFMHKIPFSKYLLEKKLNPYIDSLDYIGIHLPKHIFKKEELKEIYNKQIGDNKNKLTCTEIFMHFLEFIIYYFKFDSIYVNNSLDYQGFDSINNLLNEDIEDEVKYPNDYLFKEFFKNNYYYNKNLQEREINNKKGLILIRDPVNPFYNPGYIFSKNNFDKFYSKIKKGYEILLNTGSFEKLENLNSKK